MDGPVSVNRTNHLTRHGRLQVSNYMDDSADEQPTVCAKNLMTSVQSAVGQCHAASLKPANKNDPILSAVQWRRKVYKSRPDAKW